MLRAHSGILHGDQKRVLLRFGTRIRWNSKDEGCFKDFLPLFYLHTLRYRDASPRKPVHQLSKLSPSNNRFASTFTGNRDPAIERP